MIPVAFSWSTDSRRITTFRRRVKRPGRNQRRSRSALEQLHGTGITSTDNFVEYFPSPNIIDSLSSYPEAAAANILNAVQAAVERGSLGSIAATWTDAIALGSLHFAWPGWILQAGLSWNHSIHWVFMSTDSFFLSESFPFIPELFQDFIQQSLGDLVSMWILNEPMDRRSSVGTAIVEMGRLETWLLRHARGELQLHNGFGTLFIIVSKFIQLIPN